MNKKTCILFVFALGLALMMGCGGGGGGDNVPQSSSSYMGSSLPAVLDTTTSTQNLGVYLLRDIGQLASRFGGGAAAASLGSTSSNTSDSGEGGDGGSYTYSGSSSASWDETFYNTSVVQSLTFNDFADSGGIDIYYTEGPGNIGDPKASFLAARRVGGGEIFFPDLQAGRGSLYRSYSLNRTTDGIPVSIPTSQLLVIGPEGPGSVGSPVSDGSAYYSNYDDFFTGQGRPYDGYSSFQKETLQSGFNSGEMSGVYDSTVEYWSFEDTISADYAVDYFNSYSDDYPSHYFDRYTKALMNFSQNHAWDLSTATFISSGTYCAEGIFQTTPYVLGCVDFDVSLTWDNDALDSPSYCRGNIDLFFCYGWPDDGLVTIETGDAAASHAFTPGGGTFTLFDGNGSAVFQTNLIPPGAD